MNRLVTSIVLLSFIALSVFGFIGMDYAMDHATGGCVAAMATGTACPGKTDPMGFAGFHLTAFKTFTTASTSLPMITGLLLLVAFLFLNAPAQKRVAHVATFLPLRLTLLLAHTLRDRIRRYRFLALLEHSPVVL